MINEANLKEELLTKFKTLRSSVVRIVEEYSQMEDKQKWEFEKLKMIFANLNFGVFEIDENGYFLSLNPKGFELFDLDINTDLLELSFFSVILSVDIEVVNDCFEKAKTAKSHDFEFQNKSEVKLQSCFIPINDANEKLDRMIGMIHKSPFKHINQYNIDENDISTFVTFAQYQRDYIIKALNVTKWRVSGEHGAAKLLNLKPTTLEAKMKKLGISRNQ